MTVNVPVMSKFIKAQRLSGGHSLKKTPLLSDSRIRVLGARRLVRIGAYGDPAAVPLSVWENILTKAAGHTGYTHHWKTCEPGLSKWCMASVDSPEERLIAHAMGWRTYRIATDGDPRFRGEALCPASEELGRKLTCARCMACNGNARNFHGSVRVNIHGANWKKQAFQLITARKPLDLSRDHRTPEAQVM